MDVETTGFSRHDRIAEFACVTDVVDGAVIEEYDLIQPKRDPSPVHMHGITPEILSLRETVGFWLAGVGVAFTLSAGRGRPSSRQPARRAQR